MSIFGLYQQQNDMEIWKHVENPIYLFRINSVWVVSDIKTGDHNYNLEINDLNSNPKIKDLHSNQEIKDSYFNLKSKFLKSNKKIKDLNATLENGDLNATLEIGDLKPNFKLGNLSRPTPVRLINRLNTSYPGNLSSGWNYIHQNNMSSEIELMPAVNIHITCCSDIR
ncbi:uncharacterized protein LOC111712307 [Eurytemora carolleeae]|uniref:uncharacterized protein LOC111712307 n=1 Tax=Eurytemora carolleeae TaxID=1294199 RepID=UPI000C765C98|nr:uncharacterized protein LOC111712307 [Eurytemora carolleeae]|eukprot:XP_023342650.1 uncharacterized protein LOC111712307 [Eurytemora affinis]